MADFTLATFLPMSAMANSDAPRHYTYVTVDTKTEVVASGYFDDMATTLNVNDIIWVVASSGGTQTFTTVLVDAITAGVVTTLSTVQILA